jgi:predicted Rossmann fold flavoprotein
MPPAEWQGVALRDCFLKARQNGKVIAQWRDDLLFTHRGISGPTALGISRDVALALENGEVTIEVDCLPTRTAESLDAELQALAAKQGNKSIATFLEPLLPNRLVPFLLASAGVDLETKAHRLKREERRALVQTLKGWQLGCVIEVPLERGEVTAGGVALSEVDSQTMRSKIVKGLYLCGEVLDIAGPIGGYNLQAAFSTGYVAGEIAARDCLSFV